MQAGLVAPPIVLGMFLVSLSPNDEVVGSRIGGAARIMLLFLVLCSRIKPLAACLRAHQKLVPVVILSWEKSVSKYWVGGWGGCGLRSLCFKISLSQFLMLVRLYIP